jgi:hypothetical protein
MERRDQKSEPSLGLARISYDLGLIVNNKLNFSSDPKYIVRDNS